MPNESIKGFYAGGSFPAGFLWSQPEILGTTFDEIRAWERGEVDPTRAKQIEAAFHFASRGLETVEPRGTA